MSYIKRLNRAFLNAPILPITANTKYVFFSDCHRGSGNNNDNFLKNATAYSAALQYYYQYGFCYIEAGDGDELWENRSMYVAHGHQADLLNSVFWKLTRFLVRYLWSQLERFGVLDPTSAAKNNTKKTMLEKKYLHFARENKCMLLTGHTHKPTLGNKQSPYYNCGSCVHPRRITCIELCGYEISLVTWYSNAEKSEHFGNIYTKCPPTFPVYIKREVLSSSNLNTPIFLI